MAKALYDQNVPKQPQLSFPICKLRTTSRISKINIIVAFSTYCSKYIFLSKIQFHSGSDFDYTHIRSNCTQTTTICLFEYAN